MDYCDVFIRLSFWRHPFTAEHPLLRHWCRDTFLQIWSRNKLICISDGLRVRTFSTNSHFCLNYSFNCRCMNRSLIWRDIEWFLCLTKVTRSPFPTAVWPQHVRACQDIYRDLPHLYSRVRVRVHVLVLPGDVDVPPVERLHAGSSICLSETVLSVFQINYNHWFERHHCRTRAVKLLRYQINVHISPGANACVWVSDQWDACGKTSLHVIIQLCRPLWPSASLTLCDPPEREHLQMKTHLSLNTSMIPFSVWPNLTRQTLPASSQ